jgi:hypothetical protein
MDKNKYLIYIEINFKVDKLFSECISSHEYKRSSNIKLDIVDNDYELENQLENSNEFIIYLKQISKSYQKLTLLFGRKDNSNEFFDLSLYL